MQMEKYNYRTNMKNSLITITIYYCALIACEILFVGVFFDSVQASPLYSGWVFFGSFTICWGCVVILLQIYDLREKRFVEIGRDHHVRFVATVIAIGVGGYLTDFMGYLFFPILFFSWLAFLYTTVLIGIKLFNPAAKQNLR